MKALEMMGSYSLNSTGFQLLYNPMPEGVRGSVRAVIDGAVKKLGAAVGGLMLLALGALLVEREMLLLVMALGAALLLWIALLRPLYLVALEQKLGDRGLSVLPVIDPTERSTRQQMIRALHADDGKTTLAAISVLSELEDFDFSRHIAALIAHPAEAVRLKAISLVRQSPSPAYVPFLVSVIRDRARHHKAQAARALVLVDPSAARQVLEPILRAPPSMDEPGLTSAAIAAFLSGGTPDDMDPVVRLARGALESMIADAPERSLNERRSLAQLLGILGPGPYAQHLADLIEDSNVTVRSAAIDASALAPDARLPEFLIRELGNRDMQRPVRKALSVYGDAVVPMLARFLDDRRIEVAVRCQVPAILRMIGTDEAAAAMLYSNRHDDAYLRYTIIAELGRMRRAHPELQLDREHTGGAALRRLRAFTHYRPIHADLAAGGRDFELLARAIGDRDRQNLQAGLRLLGLLFDMKAMESAYHGFMQGIHGDAVELVDVAMAGSSVRDEVLSHLEPAPPPGHARDALERAFALVEGRDVMLASLAWQTLRRMGEHPPDVREPTSGEPLMPKSIIERVFLLQHVQFFGTLSVDDLAGVASICTEGHAEPRQTIYNEGEIGDSMYVIISGGIELQVKDNTLMVLHAGDSFGQTSILDGGLRPVSAKAGEEGVDFVRIARQPLLDLMADRPELVSGLFAELGTRVRELIALTQDRPS